MRMLSRCLRRKSVGTGSRHAPSLEVIDDVDCFMLLVLPAIAPRAWWISMPSARATAWRCRSASTRCWTSSTSWASEDPDALAVLSVDAVGEVVAEQSAADLARASREVARVLLDLGVGKGDHVFVMLPRIPEWYAALLGAMRIGAIPMPAPNLLTAKDIAYRFKQTGATAAITDEAGAEKVDAAVPGLATRLCVGRGA